MIIYAMLTMVLTGAIVWILVKWSKHDIRPLTDMLFLQERQELLELLQFMDSAEQALLEKQKFYEEQMDSVVTEIKRKEDLLATLQEIISVKNQKLYELEETEVSPKMAVSAFYEGRDTDARLD